MAPTIDYGHPTSLRAGDTWAWRIAFADFPVSEGYVLSYALQSTSDVTQAPLTWNTDFVTDDGSEFTVSIPAATTAPFVAGGYRLSAFLTLASDRYSPYSAPLLVLPDASTAAGSAVTHAEKVLGYIEAVIEGRATADVESYQINGRALNRTPIKDLLALRSRYRTEVWKERNPGFSPPGKRVSFCG